MAVFNSTMSTRIAETIRDNYDSFFSSNKTAQCASEAQAVDAWQNLTNQINGEFGTTVSVKQVQNEWHNMGRKPKEQQAEKKHKGAIGSPILDEPAAAEGDEEAGKPGINGDMLDQSSLFQGVPRGKSMSILPISAAQDPKGKELTPSLDLETLCCRNVSSSHRRALRIAQISALAETVPPKNYGSIERIAHYMTEELVKRGHHVVLFAANESKTSAKLIENGPPFRKFNPAPYGEMFAKVQKDFKEFDILHFQTDMHLRMGIDYFNETNQTKILITMHWRMDTYPELNGSYKALRVVSISDDQRTHAIGQPNMIDTVYHGIPKDLLKFVEKPNAKAYLAFLGRIDPTKRPDWAIQIAVEAGIALKIAAKVDACREEYWQNQIKPMIKKHKNFVEFLGEVNDQEKGELLGNALALIFPIDWHEPFGMVMVESMACGTPVIARRIGSVPEVVDEGISGLLFDTIDEAVQAVKKVNQIDRRGVRQAFEKRFTADKMVDGYEEIYYRILGI